jgi:hypothetical protein
VGKIRIRLEDLVFCALINQFWGSAENLQVSLDSETPRLCDRISGPEVPVQRVKVIYPQLKGEIKDGEQLETDISTRYRPGSEGAPAMIQVPALIAGNRAKSTEFIALGLLCHREALGLGDPLFDYPESAQSLLKKLPPRISEKSFKDPYSPRFVTEAIEIAREFEIPPLEFLFPISALSSFR